MDIENGTWVQLKSNTSKAYLVSSSSASNEFLDCVSPQNERKLLSAEDIEIINKMLVGTPIKEVSTRLEYEIKPIIAEKIRQYETV